MNYKDIDKNQGADFNRTCIDGSVQGCSKCKAYCSYPEHPGFLTEKHIKQHACLEKNCFYYVHKLPREKKVKNVISDKEMVEFLSDLLAKYDGMKIVEAKKCAGGIWTVYYASIAEYPMKKITSIASEACHADLIFEKREYSYENIARLLMK